jgi:hypothetical protein
VAVTAANSATINGIANAFEKVNLSDFTVKADWVHHLITRAGESGSEWSATGGKSSPRKNPPMFTARKMGYNSF